MQAVHYNLKRRFEFPLSLSPKSATYCRKNETRGLQTV